MDVLCGLFGITFVVGLGGMTHAAYRAGGIVDALCMFGAGVMVLVLFAAIGTILNRP